MSEWEAYYYFEPWGAPAEDQRAATQLAYFFRANFEGDAPERFFDRDPEETARLVAAARAKMTLEDKILAFFGPLAVDVEPEALLEVPVQEPLLITTESEPGENPAPFE